MSRQRVLASLKLNADQIMSLQSAFAPQNTAHTALANHQLANAAHVMPNTVSQASLVMLDNSFLSSSSSLASRASSADTCASQPAPQQHVINVPVPCASIIKCATAVPVAPALASANCASTTTDTFAKVPLHLTGIIALQFLIVVVACDAFLRPWTQFALLMHTPHVCAIWTLLWCEHFPHAYAYLPLYALCAVAHAPVMYVTATCDDCEYVLWFYCVLCSATLGTHAFHPQCSGAQKQCILALFAAVCLWGLILLNKWPVMFLWRPLVFFISAQVFLANLPLAHMSIQWSLRLV
jgi:hypothetical protein